MKRKSIRSAPYRRKVSITVLHENITGTAFKLFYVWLLDREDFYTTIVTLADRAGLSKRTAYRAVNELCDKRILVDTNTKTRYGAVRYRLHARIVNQAGVELDRPIDEELQEISDWQTWLENEDEHYND